MTILQTKDLRKIYGRGEARVHALDGVDLEIEKGEFVAIVGTSGSGKSTLLHMLGGLDRPTSGSVMVDGKDIFALKDEALTIFRRRKIGFVFQNYNLVPVLNVYENIVLPIELDGNRPDDAYVQNIIETLGLQNKLQNLPNNLSGGQQQRVAIARALATKPAIILADEPTGNLDSKTSQDVLSLLKVTSQKFSQTIVMITHNEEIAQLADRIVRIEDGRIVVRLGVAVMQVKNQNCIRRLSWNAMRASRMRNLIAILAIGAYRCVVYGVVHHCLIHNHSIQEANFRQVGGYSHGGFKYLTQEQFDQLKEDALIKEYGLRRFVGMPNEVPFNKSHVEVGYSDAKQAQWMYCVPTEGRLPQEGTNEAATDTRVLELLGVEPALAHPLP